MSARPRVLVLMTTHNRRETTIRCLESLFSQDGLGQRFELAIIVVDAGSSDGTPDAVVRSFPAARVLRESHHLYWASGMRRAAEACEEIDRDFDLWLNDDVSLVPDALGRMLEAAPRASDSILVGALVDGRGRPSYGGLLSGRHPLQLQRVGPSNELVECTTFNGNVVLIPRDISRRLGPVSSAFIHGMGDIDYGFRAIRAGYRSLQVPGVVGICETNPLGAPAVSQGRAARLRAMTSVKALPPRQWWTLCRRHGGVLAPILFLKPYAAELVRPS